MTNEKKERRTISRRNALKTLGVGALGVSSVGLASANSGEDTVRIPTVKRGDEVLKWKEVPRSWHEHTQHSEQVREELIEQHLDDPGIKSIASARWDKRFGGKNGLLVEVEVDPETYKDTLPDSKGGIPVRTTEAPDLRLGDCCFHDDYDPVPGGVSVHTANSGGSAGFRVNDPDGNERLLTANHLWDTCSDNTGKTLNQHTDEFGVVDSYDADTDYALVKPTSTEGIDNEVIVDGIRYRVSGYKTTSSINDLISSGETCYDTGSTTCTTEGPIKANGLSTPGFDCIDYEGAGIKADIVAGDGDSGGPIVSLDEFGGTQYAVIIAHFSLYDQDSTVSCHWGSGYKGSPIYGTAFNHLRDNHDLRLS